jgi:hypothetical protein
MEWGVLAHTNLAAFYRIFWGGEDAPASKHQLKTLGIWLSLLPYPPPKQAGDKRLQRRWDVLGGVFRAGGSGTHEALLASNEIVFILTKLSRWELPTAEELYRLGYISKHPIPDTFGPGPSEHAVSKFAEGDIQGCATIFAKMLLDREEPAIRNNLGFC